MTPSGRLRLYWMALDDDCGWAADRRHAGQADGPWKVRARPSDDGWRDFIDNCDLTTGLRRRLDSDGWQNGLVTRTDFDDDWIPLAPDFDSN